MLGKLKSVPLRQIWKNEAFDFTKWLAEPDNLSILSETIGTEMKVLQTEANAGDFKIDILAEEMRTGKKIIIENQLERSDHDHLGKIITYASGKDAGIIIWIVEEVREEHRQAIGWLNEHTDEDTYFFVIKMEVWQIENSPFAPKFQIISQPNGWAKQIKKSGEGTKPSETKLRQLEFWNQFKEYAEPKSPKLRFRKTDPQHWYDFSTGKSGIKIALTVNTVKGLIGCELYIDDDKDLYRKLHEHHEEIEQAIGSTLLWMELPEGKASRIKLERDAEFEKLEEWPEYFEWLRQHVESFLQIFTPYIKKTETIHSQA